MKMGIYDPGRWSQEWTFWPVNDEGGQGDVRQILLRHCAELLAHLARWQQQEGNQCLLWQRLIVLQRRRIARTLATAPTLCTMLTEEKFLQDAWLDALLKVIGEVNCFDLPDACPWTLEQALDQEFFPAAYLPS
ncbi:hypothetical protein FHW83_000541 [Duganella sp. SG902]|uniref:DUF29 family protein n=1 Tax=Duganella sp. SG902 TaxID=2587016 RepID=UPI00159D0B92|nr:DUF29 family protein [Duganella sp. SG902]NVM74781.1 hypothetical protein [Duganella sp. SG902]